MPRCLAKTPPNQRRLHYPQELRARLKHQRLQLLHQQANLLPTQRLPQMLRLPCRLKSQPNQLQEQQRQQRHLWSPAL